MKISRLEVDSSGSSFNLPKSIQEIISIRNSGDNVVYIGLGRSLDANFITLNPRDSLPSIQVREEALSLFMQTRDSLTSVIEILYLTA